MRIFRILFVIGCFSVHGQDIRAQSSFSPKQIWPEVDIFYKFNNQFRAYVKLTSTTLNGANTDGTLGAYLDYFSFPLFKQRKSIFSLNDTIRGSFLWFRVGYSYSQSPPGATKTVNQNIIETTVNTLYYLPSEVLMTVTNRIDWLFENQNFDPRYRPRIKFDRNFKTDYLFFNFYFYVEYYVYFNNSSQDRFRIEVGDEIKVTKWMNFQTYYLHQFGNDGTVSSIDAIGIQANLFFRKKTKKL